MRRAVRSLAALVCLGGFALALATAQGQAPPGAQRLCGGGSDAVLKKDRWTLIAQPPGLTRILAHAVGEGGNLILATDGKTVVRSKDAGCTWKTVYETALPTGEGTPIDGQLPRVSRIAVLPIVDNVLISLDGVGRAALSQVLFSPDGDEGSFVEVEGLPRATGFREIDYAPDNPARVYLTTGAADAVGQNDPAGQSGLLYVSVDFGQTWSALTAAGGEAQRVAVEPDTGGDHLWMVKSNGTIQRSEDGGGSWLPVAPPPATGEQGDVIPSSDHWRDIAVHRFSTRSHTVVLTASPAREADVTRAVFSTDKGGSWQELPVDQLGEAGGLVFGNAESQLYAAAGSQATSWRGPGMTGFNVEEQRWDSVDDLELISLEDPRSVNTPLASSPQFRSIYLRMDRAAGGPEDLIARFEPPPPPDGPLRLSGRPDCGDPSARAGDRKKVVFDPGGLDVKLTPGEEQRVPIVADVEGDRTPIDLEFLLDNSESMDPAIEGVFCSVERLVRELPRRHLDMQFGLSAYNDIQTETYERKVQISPPKDAGPAISAALKLLFTLRGVQEPLRSALYQIATGAGLDVRVANPQGPGTILRRVEPGQQAEWRPPEKKALRAVLVITDEPYEATTEGEPPLADVIASLRAKNIRVIGLRVNPLRTEQLNPNDTDHSPVRQLLLEQQLIELARETGMVAPKGGVDCDGGGTPDVPEGAPVVCTIDERGIRSEIDDTLVSILTSLSEEDRKQLRLVPRKTDGLQTAIEGGSIEVNLRRDHKLESTAVLTCTPEQEGERFDLVFDVVAGERVLGTLEGRAQCGELPAIVPPVKPRRPAKSKPEPKPAPKPEPAPAPAPPAPAAAAAPVQAPQPAAAAAPPAPPPAPAPAQGAPAQAPAQAAASQPGAAVQEARRVQVTAATISSDGPSESGRAAREHLMVAVRQQPVMPPATLWTLGVGLAGLIAFVGVGMAPRRRRHDLAKVHVDDR